MTLFWVSSVILIAIAFVFVAIPLIKKKANIDVTLRDELNKAFYKDRLAELEVETDEGLVDNQQELVSDLKQSLLDDIPVDGTQVQGKSLSTSVILFPSLILIVALSYGLYSTYGGYSQVLQWQDVNNGLPELSQKLMTSHGAELSGKEMQDLTLALRTRLYYNSQDATGWLLLGRVGLANHDMATAVGAMEKAFAINPQDGDIRLGYAQAMMMSTDQMNQQKARDLLNKMLDSDYIDLRVYSLLAFDAYERKDYATAIKHWQSIQKMIGSNDGRYASYTQAIASAKSKLEQTGTSGKSVSVTVSLGSNVQLPAQAVMIVSVHTADGSPMPVAAARYPLNHFPVTVVLDDSNSMMQGRKLSDLDSVMVRVRIDSDGNVATKEGDWFGESPVTKNGNDVNVEINQQF